VDAFHEIVTLVELLALADTDVGVVGGVVSVGVPDPPSFEPPHAAITAAAATMGQARICVGVSMRCRFTAATRLPEKFAIAESAE